MKMEPAVIGQSPYGDHTTFTQGYAGWPGSGFSKKTVRLAVRLVAREGGEEAQIEVEITATKGRRDYREVATLALTPEQIEAFISALQRIV